MSKFTESVAHHCRGLHSISSGGMLGCAECGLGDYGKNDDSDEAQHAIDVASEGFFSWSSCDSCGSTLGGNRYNAHGVVGALTRDEGGWHDDYFTCHTKMPEKELFALPHAGCEPHAIRLWVAERLPGLRWKSIAVWPSGTCQGNQSSDHHDTKEQAEGVAYLLKKNGFGGDRKIFPVQTFVEPELV